MKREVYCQKLQKKAEGLSKQTYPGTLGDKIYQNISQEAWEMWKQQQTMLINEFHLNPLEIETRQYLEQQMEIFLFKEN
ncbi:MAG: oxidative damage protection protein [Legionellales bacterium]|nr:oxidative damage protection protein [Legionellales bacterium]